MSRRVDYVDDINDAWVLALTNAGVSREVIDQARLTVEDAIDNNLEEG